MPEQTILVTGGASFIGPHVVGELLNSGSAVIVYDNFRFGYPRTIEHLGHHPRIRVVEGDVRNVEHLGRAMPDVDGVVHVGA